MVDSIMIVGVLTYGTLFHFVWFKSHADECVSLIQVLIFHTFELGHNSVEATENICCAKDAGAVDMMVQEILLGLQKSWWSRKVR